MNIHSLEPSVWTQSSWQYFSIHKPSKHYTYYQHQNVDEGRTRHPHFMRQVIVIDIFYYYYFLLLGWLDMLSWRTSNIKSHSQTNIFVQEAICLSPIANNNNCNNQRICLFEMQNKQRNSFNNVVLIMIMIIIIVSVSVYINDDEDIHCRELISLLKRKKTTWARRLLKQQRKKRRKRQENKTTKR